MSDFLYEIITIPAVNSSPNNLQLSAFRNVVKLTDSGNSNIYTAFYTEVNANVVIKIIKQEKMHDIRVINEFELEYQLLIRLDHPNIIKTYGRGVTADRRFIVLEYLEGGTMQKVLEIKSDERRNIFGRKSRFTYEEVLQQGIQLADALNYLHSKVVINKACIIHRGTIFFVALYLLLSM
jgi:serine/threonine protein kinase